MFGRLVEVESEDALECAAALRLSVIEQRLAGARRLALAARWADLHPPVAWNDPSLRHRGLPATRRRGYRVGAVDNPEISEFAAVELGMLLETSTRSAERLLADALDLRHRLPLLWEAVMSGQVDDWKARKVATLVRPLTTAQAATLDAEVVTAVVGLPFGRAVDVVQGRVIAADPAAHAARREAEQERRYVATGRRSNAYGLRTLIAQTTAGDIARLDAMVSHLAGLLAANGDPDPADTRRAKALGLLANPALACVLLAQTTPSQPRPSSPPDDSSAVELGAWFGRLLQELGATAVDRLRPRSVLYVHLAEEALRGVPATAVARVEELGPISLSDLTTWLGHDRITVNPVIDPTDAEPVDSHEIPVWMRERHRLTTPFEVFPYGTLPASRADLDHTTPYRDPADGGPPGQTRLDNLGPLGRRHHRAKTLGGFSLHQPRPGVYLWRTPTGYWYRVENTGTTALGSQPPEILRLRSARDDSTAEQHLTTLLDGWALAS